MRGTTLEVAMLADVSGAYSAISNVYIPMCDVLQGPSDMSLRHSLWMDLTLIGQQNINDYELMCQFINYYDILQLF